MRRPRLVVFDWDGTLMDSADHIVAAVRAAATDLGWRPPAPESVREVIGLGLREAVGRALPDLHEADYERFVNRYRIRFLDPATARSVPFAGVSRLLEDLAGDGWWLAVATGKGRQGLDRALDETGLAAHFLTSRCADETRSKPHPAMLEEILDELGVFPDEAVMVGDTEFDLEMAANARVDALGVGWGAHPRDRLQRAGPLAIAPSIGELSRLLGDVPRLRAGRTRTPAAQRQR